MFFCFELLDAFLYWAVGDFCFGLVLHASNDRFSTPVFLACFVSALTHCDAWQPRFCAPALRRLERLNLPRPVSGTSDEAASDPTSS